MSNYDLKELYELAKKDDEEAIKEIIDKFEPLTYKNSYINGEVDPDCIQELHIKLYNCIKNFDFRIKEDFKKYLDII
ncbi:helix-turn-helix domain-containing protein [Irregularibacter muris]|uniref:Helix-turn-helix domain-containing protein n=1 Tax=Irregularibacter muris TaxID=1796619 RepID=A0AAE3HG53_9FIRM|nr:helix-turn-helix domain-containing protein [Irregularibacter muris]MCR1899967.1 helix-turn-helix domain-containing protein [Irregularibacter muris]